MTKHNVTTANEFVEATYASNGIRGVFAYETRLNKDSSNFSPQFPKYSLMHNFSFNLHRICVRRSWKIGNGKFVAFSALENPRSINTINCSDTPNGKTLMFVTGQPRTKQRNPSNRSTDVRKHTNIIRLFECYEEGCIKIFFYQGESR